MARKPRLGLGPIASYEAARDALIAEREKVQRAHRQAVAAVNKLGLAEDDRDARLEPIHAERDAQTAAIDARFASLVAGSFPGLDHESGRGADTEPKLWFWITRHVSEHWIENATFANAGIGKP